MQGVPGECVHDHHKCDCGAEFAEVYSVATQNLFLSPGPNQQGGVVTLEQTVYATSNIDVSQAAALGKIVINNRYQ